MTCIDPFPIAVPFGYSTRISQELTEGTAGFRFGAQAANGRLLGPPLTRQVGGEYAG